MKQKLLQISLLLFFSILISITIASFNSTFANFVWKTFYPFKGLQAYHTLFYSYPLIIGLLLTFFDPKKYGLLPEKTFEYWKICLMWFLIIIIPILTYLKNVDSTPFHGMSWQVYILAPIGEELIFRGALYTWVYEAISDIIEGNNKENNLLERIRKTRNPILKRGGIRKKIIDLKNIKDILKDEKEEEFNDNKFLYVTLTIIISSLAFGFWHIPNIFVNPSYTLSQISYTMTLGLIFGYLRFKTKSIYICVFIHCIINFLATIS
ncbi:MAG: CPBP family intramembrane glutamic endopeptidase [Candidatus Sericytochromatia bacterium]